MLHAFIARWRQRRHPPFAPTSVQIEAYQERERELIEEISRLQQVRERYKEGAWLLALVVEDLDRCSVDKQSTMYVAASSFVRDYCLECGAQKDDQAYTIGSRFCSRCAKVRLRRHQRAEPDNIEVGLPCGVDGLERS